MTHPLDGKTAPPLPWDVVKALVEAGLEHRTLRLRSPLLDASDTAFLRGECRALEWVLRLPKLEHEKASLDADD